MEQATKQALNKLATTRPIGKLIDGGHIHLGFTVMEFSRVEVEADVETCGDNLRILIYVGDALHYTTRLTKIGQLWYVTDKHAVLLVGKQSIKLGELKFYAPQDFGTFFFSTVFTRINKRYAAEGIR